MIGYGIFELIGETTRPKSRIDKTRKFVIPESVSEVNLRQSISTSEAVLSWSPKKEVTSEPGSDHISTGSSKHTFSSSEVLQRTPTGCGVPSPGTFGFPSPLSQMSVGSPNSPHPPFHSTPKIKSSHKLMISPVRLMSPSHEPISVPSSQLPFISSRRDQSYLRSEQRIDESFSRRNEPGERDVRARLSTFSSQSSRRPQRRKSAEWNAHAASAGVNADPSQRAEFGWPAEVSHEILRLSLGRLAAPKVSTYDVSASTKIESRRDRRMSITTNGKPRVSHESKIVRSSDRMRSKEDREQSFSSVYPRQQQSLSTPLPVRNNGRDSLVTQHSSSPRAPSVAPRKSSKTRSILVADNVLEAKTDDRKGALSSTGSAVYHRRSGSVNQEDWSSENLQNFIKDANMELFSSELTTPIKQSASHSSYDTAGSSSFLHAPSLSVITATPQSSQSRSRRQSGANSDLGSDNLQVPPVPTLPEQSEKGKGKRKADDSEDVAPPEKRSSKTKKTTFAEGKRKSFSFGLFS